MSRPKQRRQPVVVIGGRAVGPGQPVFTVAEAGCNHECDLATARRMVRAAARAGVDAIKFQTYKAETLATHTAPTYWKQVPGAPRTQFDFFKQLDHFDRQEYAALAEECRRAGILFMSTPWDFRSADLLQELDVPAFKIGSADLTYLPLIRHCARKGKPMILATGASTIADIERAVHAVYDAGNRQLILLHCILAYHTLTDDVHLAQIRELQRRFPACPIGFSDHTIADEHLTVQIAAVATGACVVEKHYTLDKRARGNDHWHALEPSEFQQMVRCFDLARRAMGRGGERKPLPCERPARRLARRSIVTARAIAKGAVLTETELTCKRPGTGIPPYDLPRVIGCRTHRAIPEDTVITWSMLEHGRARGVARHERARSAINV